MKTFAMVLILMIMLPITAQADITGQISFQGTLTDPSGVGLDTTVVMQFEIYTDSTGGTRLWGVSRLVDVHQGIFNVLLGRTSAIPDSIFEEFPRWLTFSVEDDPYMEPRLRMAAVGYAMRSAESDTADYARSAPTASDGDWTVVTNDMYSSISGNVGIGTSNPGYKLDVEDDGWRQIRARGTDPLAAGGLNVLNDTGDYAQFALRGSGAASHPGDLVIGPYSQTGDIHLGNGNFFPKMTVKADGNVGIGTASPAHRLDVHHDQDTLSTIGVYNTYIGGDFDAGIALVLGDNNGTPKLTLRQSGDGSLHHSYISHVDNSSSSLILENQNTAGNILLRTNGQNRVAIDADGNVGIGTTAPSRAVHIYSSSGGANLGIVTTDAGSRGQVIFGDSTGNQWTISQDNADTNKLHLRSGPVVGTTRVTFQQDGNVGIGTTTPGSKLEVGGQVHSTSGGFKFPDGSTQTSAAAGDGHSLDAADGSPADAVFVDNIGLVGIGLTGPICRLDVRSPGAGSDYFRGMHYGYNGDDGGAWISTWASSIGAFSGGGYYHNAGDWTAKSTAASAVVCNSGHILFYGNSGLVDNVDFIPTERMRITNAGNVGVGTTNPNGPLHVQSTTSINSGNNFADRIAPLVIGDGDGGNECILIDGNQIEQADTTAQSLNLNYDSPSDVVIAYGGGNVGIGTSSPGAKLHVNGSIRGNQSGALRIDTGAGYLDVGPKNAGYAHFATDRPSYHFDTEIQVGTGNIGSYNANLSLRTSGTTRITVENATGDVGIGTSSPAGRMHIHDTGDPAIILDTDGTDWHVGLDDSDSDKFKIGTGTSIGSGGKMIISGEGNVGIGTNIPMYKMHVYSDTSSPTVIYSRKDVTGSSWAAAVMGVSSTRNYGYLGGEMGTSSEPISSYNYGVYGRVQGTGWGGFGGMFYNTSGNWAALAGDDNIGYDYAVYAKHDTGTVGYLASSAYGAYGGRDNDHYGVLGYEKKRASYFYHREAETDGDGQTAVYAFRSRDSRNDGTGYGDDESNYAIQGYNLWGDEYTFGTAGHNFNDFNRCGGALGANHGGDYWGSLGYRSSGSVNYGGYFVSTMTGTGKGERGDDPAIGVGVGAWGELFGADIHGQVYGTYTEGGDYALYSHGTVFKDDLDVHLQHGRGEGTSVLYTNVSTDVTVQTSGFATLSGGKSFIRFDQDFEKAVSPDVPIVVTVTPTGDCNGVHVSGVTTDGFTVVENNAGKSSVQVAFIAVGRRAGYEDPRLPAEVVSGQYAEKVSRGLHNDGDTRTDGEGLYFENDRLYVGVHHSTLPDLNKREEDLRPSPRLKSEKAIEEDEPARRLRGSNN